MAKIQFDGQEYDSVEAMPADVRRLFDMANELLADKNKDGVPDLFERAGSSSQVSVTQVVVDGKTYGSLDELPPDARRRYDEAMGRIDAARAAAAGAPEARPPAQGAPPAPSPQIPHVQVIGGASSGPTMRLLLGAVVILLLIVAVLLFLLLAGG